MFNVYWYVLVGVVLFFVLSPGVLITLPAQKTDCNGNKCSMWAQTVNGKGGCATSILAVAVHTLIFGIIFVAFMFYAQTKL